MNGFIKRCAIWECACVCGGGVGRENEHLNSQILLLYFADLYDNVISDQTLDNSC